MREPWTSIAEVQAGLAAVDTEFLASQDRRGVFLSAYREITDELAARIGRGQFEDAAWVGRLAVAFSELYRVALGTYERLLDGALPHAWRVAFEASAGGRTLVVQDLILGISAHINHDLPVAIATVGLQENREARARDFAAINDALEATTNRVQDRIARRYAMGLGVLDRLLGGVDEELTSFAFDAARSNAWAHGVALAAIEAPAEREALRQSIDRAAATLARVILAPAKLVPGMLRVARWLESGHWADYVRPPT